VEKLLVTLPPNLRTTNTIGYVFFNPQIHSPN